MVGPEPERGGGGGGGEGGGGRAKVFADSGQKSNVLQLVD